MFAATLGMASAFLQGTGATDAASMGFEATLNVSMGLQSRLKTEIGHIAANDDSGSSDGIFCVGNSSPMLPFDQFRGGHDSCKSNGSAVEYGMNPSQIAISGKNNLALQFDSFKDRQQPEHCNLKHLNSDTNSLPPTLMKPFASSPDVNQVKMLHSDQSENGHLTASKHNFALNKSNMLQFETIKDAMERCVVNVSPADLTKTSISPVGSKNEDLLGDLKDGNNHCRMNGSPDSFARNCQSYYHTQKGSSKSDDVELNSEGSVNDESDHSSTLMPDVSMEEDDDDDPPLDPLVQLQNTLERNGVLGVKCSGGGSADSGCGRSPAEVGDDGHDMMDDASPDGGSGDMLYRCHECNFATSSKTRFNSHLSHHYDHKCNQCEYTSRSEGRLKRHLKDFHGDCNPGDDFANSSLRGQRDSANQNKPKTYRCKQCSFVAITKADFWDHNKTHIKAEKLLTCPKCPFVTEYKHHLEYHLRNHYGSKPFKCNKCNYSCVNKSMLNSHMKSHSNIYQYRCSDCTYATKYCHSLKLHLRKYNHKPATVLNPDGTPNPLPVIDIYGSRRGPRSKKNGGGNNIDGSLSPLNYPQLPMAMNSGFPFLYPSPILNGFHKPMYEAAMHVQAKMKIENHISEKQEIEMNSYAANNSAPEKSSHSPLPEHENGKSGDSHFKCNLCDFNTTVKTIYNKHMLLHAASENQDLCSLYGISSESLLVEQQRFYNNCQVHNQQEQLLSQKETQHNVNLPESLSLESNNQNERSSDIPHKNGTNSTSSVNIPIPHTHCPTSHTSTICNLPNTESITMGFPSAAVSNTGILINGGLRVIENTRSVIFGPELATRFPLPLPPGPFLSDNGTMNVEPSSKPLDLSNNKDVEFLTKQIATVNELNGKNMDHPMRSKAALQLVQTNSGQQMSFSHSPSESPPRSRRKGKAFKLDRICRRLKQERNSPTAEDELSHDEDASNDSIQNDDDETYGESVTMNSFRQISDSVGSQLPSKEPPKLVSAVKCNSVNGHHRDSESPHEENESGGQNPNKKAYIYECRHCDMCFKDPAIYTMHMGFHNHMDPFKCNRCGESTNDKVSFFIHVTRVAHCD